MDQAVSPTFPKVIWDSLSHTARLPCPVEQYLATHDVAVPNCRRSHHRVPCRGRAAMYHGATVSGVYMIDVSPKGVGFYSPTHLLPRTEVVLRLECWDELKLHVCRCQRVEDSCYICGAVFQDGPMNPAMYRDFLRQMQAGEPD